VFKNAIDWLGRPSRDISRVFGGMPIGLVGASPGTGGTRLLQTACCRCCARSARDLTFGRSVFIAGAGQVFDQDGAQVDAKMREVVRRYMAGLAEFVGAGG
jgi:chromate reductase, NAD(P)H dehydrogenase (quinone)